MLEAAPAPAAAPAHEPFEGFERRFGGLRRLYGSVGAQRIFDAHAVVVGIGGVGSWAAEALARSGVGRLTLIDLDHLAESNINRQLHALSDTLGQSKVLAMQQRIAQINPAAQVHALDEFVSPANWDALMQQIEARNGTPQALIDACDQRSAKETLAAWALQAPLHFITCGAAGGKRQAHRIEVADLSDTTHDPLLARLRARLRRFHAAAARGPMELACVFSREPVASPDPSCAVPGAGDGSLNCHGYGSSVAVTAGFGMVAAGWVLERIATAAPKRAT
ncbi:MAG: heme biosynthesis protein HemY [Comamonadaceae bacterium BICA1-1]|nr:MAG: heme biosynthesis protein HemY [Comamonadaceae bacterium BICA1-1]